MQTLRILVTVFLMMVGLLAGSIAWATFYAGENQAIGGMISSGYGGLVRARPERLWFVGGLLGAGAGVLVSKLVFSMIESSSGTPPVSGPGAGGYQRPVLRVPNNVRLAPHASPVVPAEIVPPPVMSRCPPNPNLIACPDCGHEVSRRAASCPNCGCPISVGSTAQQEACLSCPHCQKTLAVSQTLLANSENLQCPFCKGCFTVDSGKAAATFVSGTDEQAVDAEE